MMDYSIFNPLHVLPFGIAPGLVQSDGSQYPVHGHPSVLYGSPQHFLPVPHLGNVLMHALSGASVPVIDWSAFPAYPACGPVGILLPEIPRNSHSILALGGEKEPPSRPAVPVPSTSPMPSSFWDVTPVGMISPKVKAEPNPSRTCHRERPQVKFSSASLDTTNSMEKDFPTGKVDCCTSSSSPVPAKKRCPRVSKCSQASDGEGRKPEKRHPYARKPKPSLGDITNQALERYYSQTAFPDELQVNHIANHLCMTPQDVCDWFQKRRVEKQQMMPYESHPFQVPNYPFHGYPVPTLGYFTPMPAFPMSCGQPRRCGKPLGQ